MFCVSECRLIAVYRELLFNSSLDPFGLYKYSIRCPRRDKYFQFEYTFINYSDNFFFPFFT